MTANRKKSSDALGGCLVILALAVFLTVLFFIVGGWVFSSMWGIFMVPVFALPAVDITQGIAAIILIWLAGFSFRGVKSPKDD